MATVISWRAGDQSGTISLRRSPFLWIWRPRVVKPVSVFVQFYLSLSEGWRMPSLVYLYIALFTELLNLASGDVPVLVTVSTLVERQASADAAFSRSCADDNTALLKRQSRAAATPRGGGASLMNETHSGHTVHSITGPTHCLPEDP